MNNSQFLNYCMFMTELLDFKTPNDKVVNSIIEKYKNDKYTLLSILGAVNCIEMSLKDIHSLEELFDYNKSIVYLFCDKLHRKYNDNIIDILVTYSIPVQMVYQENIGMQKMIEFYEKILYSADEDIEDDEIWFMRESIKRRLLHIYTMKPEYYIEKSRNLHSIIKVNKDRFNNIKTSIESTNV